MSVGFHDTDDPAHYLYWEMPGSPEDARRHAEWLARNGAPMLAGLAIDVAEEKVHHDYERHRELFADSTRKDPRDRWRSTGRDPLAYPDALPPEAITDPGFEPMCSFCRARYGLGR